MDASTSTVVPSAQDEDISMLRAVLGRTSQEVKDYTVQYEDHVKLVQPIGYTVNEPENKSVLDVLAMRERRLNAALARKANAIEKLVEFCVADKSVPHAQSAAATTAFAIRYYYYSRAFYNTRRFQQENYEAEAAGARRRMKRPRKKNPSRSSRSHGLSQNSLGHLMADYGYSSRADQ